jgi:shikimate kinase
MTENAQKSNIVLIGMPGAGKSTIGVLLAKKTALDFTDTDLLIQTRQGDALQKILDSQGYLALRAIEEKVILSMNCTHQVIATGGSAVYSEPAMEYLKKTSIAVFLDVNLDEIKKRVNDFDDRGIARRQDQTFEDLFAERVPLYQKYADITINCENKNQDIIAEEIAEKTRHLL